MADTYTGLGKTLEEYVNGAGNELTTLLSAYQKTVANSNEITKQEFKMGEIYVKNDDLFLKEDDVLIGHINCFDKISSLLKIPNPYLMRLSIDMRAININYWFDSLKDSVVSVWTRSFDHDVKPWVVNFIDASKMRIELEDCLRELVEHAGGNSYIFNTDSSLGYTQIDILIPEKRYNINGIYFNGGIRFIHKKKLQAPEIVPIFLNENSCGIAECDGYLDALSIRELSYDQILSAIGNKIDNAVDSLDGLAYVMRDVANDEIPMMRKRAIHMCDEHGVPGRVKYTVVNCFDEYRAYDDKYADGFGTNMELISLFTSSCFISEIKMNSVRKLQKLSGYVFVKARREHRCNKCDAILLDED